LWFKFQRGAAVAGVGALDAFDIRVSARLEQLHQDRLDRLGLVEQSLSADLHSADGRRVDVVLLEEGRDGGQGQRVYVLAVVAEGHFGLAQADGVFALGHAIEFLELGLVDALAWKVKLDGLDADILGTSVHVGLDEVCLAPDVPLWKVSQAACLSTHRCGESRRTMRMWGTARQQRRRSNARWACDE